MKAHKGFLVLGFPEQPPIHVGLQQTHQISSQPKSFRGPLTFSLVLLSGGTYLEPNAQRSNELV